ncbi:MAG: hypothetical protein LIO65_04535 [Odoribacter sp.]|nr:hypothetical protein [Odoribacter sp.]
MKRLILLLLIVISFNSFAQNNYFYPLPEGTTLLYKFYDGQGNAPKLMENVEELWIKYTVKELHNYKDSTVMYMNMDVSVLHELNKLEEIKNLLDDFMSLKCKQYKDSVYTDNFIANLLTASMEMDSQNTSFDFEQIQKMSIPVKFKVGQELPDYTIMDMSMSLSTNIPDMDTSEVETSEVGMSKMMDMSVVSEYKNRKIEKKEKIKTPCGKFSCYKMTFDNVTTVGMGIFTNTVQEKVIEWVSPQIGMVKMEKYDENGNLTLVQILEEYTR